MKRALVLLAIGATLVGVVGLVVLLVDGDFPLFALIDGIAAIVIVAVGTWSFMGADKERPPGRARVSAARWAGPADPDTLGASEAAYEPAHDAAADDRMEPGSSAGSFLLAAIPPAIPAVVYFIWFA